METRHCKNCGKEFKAFPQRIKIGRAKFCSKKCGNIYRRNKLKRSCLTCEKEFMIKPSRLKYGLGKYCSKKCFHTRPDRPKEEKHHCWKGDNVGYWALHDWVTKKKGRPKKCDDCGTTTAKKFEWANISGKYRRDVNDWKRLCKKCHVHFDNNIVVGEQNGQSKLTEKKVKEIRWAYEHEISSYKSLAKEFKVSVAAIQKVIKRKTWKHI